MTSPMDAHDTDAKLSLQRRQQLSALVDGDMAPDQGRFLLRRLEHDAELAGRWQRWHLIGDVLRGQPVAALAGGDAFAARVAAAVSREGARPAPARRPRWQHIAALAASVAVVALFVTRPPAVDSGPADDPAETVVAVEAPAMPPQTPPAAVPALPPSPAAEPARDVSVPQFAEATSAPNAPAPAAAGDARRALQVAAASPPRDESAAPDTAEDADAASRLVLATSDASVPSLRPFSSPDEPQARPWPRATLPTMSAQAGRFTVGFGDSGQPSHIPLPSFYPFEPQLPVGPAAPDAGAGAGDPPGDN